MALNIKQIAYPVIASIVGCIIALAMLTYHADDPSLIFQTTGDQVTRNMFAGPGAWLSGFLLYFFGWSSLFIAAFCFLLATSYLGYINLTRDRKIAGASIPLLMSIVSYFFNFELYYGIMPGGYLGALGAGCLLSFLSAQHAAALSIILLLCAIIVLDQFESARLIRPVAQLVLSIPYAAITAYCLSVLHALQKHARAIGSWCLDAITTNQPQEELEDEVVDVHAIFNDPLWFGATTNASSSLEPENDFMQSTEYDQSTNPVDESNQREPHPASEHELNEQDLHKRTLNEQKLNQRMLSQRTLNQRMLYRVPTLKKTDADDMEFDKAHKAESQNRASILKEKLERFGIYGDVVSITHGPVVTLFEYQPAIDMKIKDIVAREDDLALALQAISLRIIAPIPGKSVVGFEVAHTKRKPVMFNHLVNTPEFSKSTYILPLILGKDTLGQNVVIDLASMPHVLVAGSTGSGKSVGLNTFIMSLLLTKSPDDLKCILIDPKRLEFSSYADIAHLVFQIITEPARAVMVLKWAVNSMEERYKTMAAASVRNIEEYRALGPDEKLAMPYLVIIIDELADLMMTAGKDCESLIARLAQMARAAGIHLILATQRPSVDIITGLIKVNFPSRIAFKVTSKIDSRTIIDTMGAEKLLGKGDMLYLDTRGSLQRIHGAYVTDAEIHAVVDSIKKQRAPVYEPLMVTRAATSDEARDELFDDVVTYARERDEISISLIQRVFRIGYNRSARLMDQLEQSGYILPSDGSKMRKVVKQQEA